MLTLTCPDMSDRFNSDFYTSDLLSKVGDFLECAGMTALSKGETGRTSESGDVSPQSIIFRMLRSWVRFGAQHEWLLLTPQR